MLRYIVKRIINLIPVALIISIMLFAFSKAMPGDPIQAMIPTTGRMTKAQKEEMYKNLSARYGYDKPLPEQYVRWLGRTLKGDLVSLPELEDQLRNSYLNHLKIQFT